MNTPYITRAINIQSIRRAAAVVVITIVISGAVALGLASLSGSSLASATAQKGAAPFAARYVALKDAQAEASDLTVVPTPVLNARYIALKDRQAEASDTTVVPEMPQSPRERYFEFKQRQAEALN